MLQFLTVLDEAWTVQLFLAGDARRAAQASRSLARHLRAGRLRLEAMDERWRAQLEGPAGITGVLTDRAFWDRVAGEVVLTFAADTVLCANSRHRIEDFLDYDYVGAPWSFNRSVRDFLSDPPTRAVPVPVYPYYNGNPNFGTPVLGCIEAVFYPRRRV